MNVTFREYNDEDKTILLELANQLENHAKNVDPIQRIRNSLGFTEIALSETLENVKKYQGKIWLAQDNTKTIGFIIGVVWKQSEKNKLEIGPHKLGEVLDVYLHEEYRGKGIGKRMLQMMEDYFKGEACDSMWIGVFAPNKNAHEMYLRFGFIDREIGMLKRI